MKLYVMDECSQNWDEEIGFFIYGGIVVDDYQVIDLTKDFIKIKKENGVHKGRPIKWSNNKPWQGEPKLDEEIHKKVKEDILDLVSASQIKIIICLSPQSFFHVPKKKGDKVYMAIDEETQKRTHEYGVNDAMYQFNKFLREEKELGMVLADEFNEALKEHMTDHCFNIFPDSMRERIIHPVIQLKNEHSHLHQINDVVLGAIYYSLREMGHNSLPKIAGNFWKMSSDPKTTFDYGFTVFPQLAKYDHIRDSKKRIKDKFVRQCSV
jgi:hypothetical protein